MNGPFLWKYTLEIAVYVMYLVGYIRVFVVRAPAQSHTYMNGRHTDTQPVLPLKHTHIYTNKYKTHIQMWIYVERIECSASKSIKESMNKQTHASFRLTERTLYKVLLALFTCSL